MVILDFISAVLFVVYVVLEKRYIVPILYELTFITVSSDLVIISYFLSSFVSLALSSIIFLMAVVNVIRVGRLVEKWRKVKSKKS